jgi:hypothetical protein
MKTNFIIILSAFLISFGFSSCVTTNQGFQSAPVISRSVDIDPIKADIVVDQESKLKGESKSVYLLFFRLKGDNKYADNINFSAEANTTKRLLSFLNPFYLVKRIATGDAMGKVKAAAAYKALQNSDADVLVHPMYTITEKSFLIFYIFKAEVTGYAGVYKNFRTEKQKIVILENGKEIVFPEK